MTDARIAGEPADRSPAPADWRHLDATLRAEADALLADGLHDTLTGYASVHVVGSYRMRLMAWRDLDIHLVPEVRDRRAFFELGGRLAELLRPRRMRYRDETVSATEGLPAGLYWGVHLGDERGADWKLDIWATDARGLERVDSYCARIERRLTPGTREAILRLKAESWPHPEYRRSFGSGDIYEAVLDHGIGDPDAFRAFLDRRAQ